MKIPPLTRDQVRQVDRLAIEQYGLPGIVLMENAGRGAAEWIDQLAPGGRIVILCGRGNNGGDGYVIARHLQLAGHQVRIVSLVALDQLSGDARINADVAAAAQIDIRIAENRADLAAAIEGAATIVDCLLGTGARGPLRGLYSDAVAIANAAAASMRIAIDLPTGLDCDTGLAADPSFRADHTITFVARKVGFEIAGANEFVGAIHEVGIGVPLQLLQDLNLLA